MAAFVNELGYLNLEIPFSLKAQLELGSLVIGSMNYASPAWYKLPTGNMKIDNFI